MSSNDRNEDQHRSQSEPHQPSDRQEGGRTGEGAASAMRHIISQGDRHSHQGGNAGDASGHAQ